MYPNAQCVSDQRFIYSPWTPVVGRTERQEKDENSENLAGDRKLDGRPPKPGGLNLWGSRRDHQLGLLDTKQEGKAGNVGLLVTSAAAWRGRVGAAGICHTHSLSCLSWGSCPWLSFLSLSVLLKQEAGEPKLADRYTQTHRQLWQLLCWHSGFLQLQQWISAGTTATSLAPELKTCSPK